MKYSEENLINNLNTMKAKLQFTQSPTQYGYKITKLERIKIIDNNGKYIKFAPHNDSIMEFLQEIEIELPDYIDIISK